MASISLTNIIEKMKLENLTPVLSPEEKKKRKREIENNLYDIFSKYGDRFL